MGTGLGHLLPLAVYLLCLISCALAFSRPAFGAYILVPLLPEQTGRYKLLDFPLGNHIIDVLMLSMAAGLVFRGKRVFPKTPLGKYFAILVVTSYVSLWAGTVVMGFDVPLSGQRLTDLLIYLRLPLMFYLILGAVENKREMAILIGTMFMSFVWVGKGFYKSVGHRDFSHFSNDLRDSGALGWAGANGLAAFQLEFTVFLAGLYACIGWKLHLRILYLAGMVVGTLSVLFSYSRGAYLGMLGACFYIGVAKWRILLIGVVLVLVAWQTVLPNSVQERITMTVNTEGAVDNSSQERINLWEEVFILVKKDPLFGIGYNGFPLYRTMRARVESINGLRDTHNMYLRALVEGGFVGLGVLLLIHFKLMRLGHQLFRRAKDPLLRGLGLGFAAHMIAVILCNCFGDRWTYVEITGYTVALAAMVMRGLWMCEAAEAAPIAAPARVAPPKRARYKVGGRTPTPVW